MKKLMMALATSVMTLVLSITAQASAKVVRVTTEPCLEPTLMRVTYYTDTGIMANGQQTRPNVIATAKEYMGCVAQVYEKNADGSMGNMIGLYEVCDTGKGLDIDGDGEGESLKQLPTIHGGTGLMSVDFWFPDDEQGQAFLDKYGTELYFIFVIGKG